MVDFQRYRTVSFNEMIKTGGGAAGGLTVRDYFAGQMLVAIADNFELEKEVEFWEGVAEVAYAAADAMMKERNKPVQQPAPTVEEAFGLDK